MSLEKILNNSMCLVFMSYICGCSKTTIIILVAIYVIICSTYLGVCYIAYPPNHTTYDIYTETYTKREPDNSKKLLEPITVDDLFIKPNKPNKFNNNLSLNINGNDLFIKNNEFNLTAKLTDVKFKLNSANVNLKKCKKQKKIKTSLKSENESIKKNNSVENLENLENESVKSKQ